MSPDPSVLPDGTVLPSLYGSQMPTWWVTPPRHKEKTEGCRSCQSDNWSTGCGEYISKDAVPWLREVANYDLDPWQEWTLTEQLGCRPDGKWSARNNALIVTRQNGKGVHIEARELIGLFMLSEPLIIHTSHEFKTTVKHIARIVDAIQNNPKLSKRLIGKPKMSHGEESIKLKPTEAIIFGSSRRQFKPSVSPEINFLARSRGSGRGFTCDFLVYDEAMILTEEQVDASRPTMSAVPNSQILYTASSAMKDSFQLAKLHWKILAGDNSMFGAEWAIEPHLESCPVDRIRGRSTNNYVICDQHDDRDDPRAWAKSNPAYNIRISPETLLDDLGNMSGTGFDREHLGVGEWPAQEDAWAVISEETWKLLSLEDPGEIRKPVTFAVDVEENGNSATIAACWVRRNESAWMRNDRGEKIRVEDEPAEHYILEIPANCSRPGTDWVLPELNRLRKAYRPAAIVFTRQGPGAALIGGAEKLFGKDDKTILTAGTADEAAAFALLMQFCNREHQFVRHLGQEKASRLWYAVARGMKRQVGDGGFSWSRRDSTADISPITAATLALWACNKKRRSYNVMNTVA